MIPKQIRALGAAMILSSLTLGFAAASQAGGMPARADRAASTTACKQAMLSAWFERQRQLTDGDTDLTRALPLPRECRAAQAANESEDGKREQVAVRAESAPSD